MPGDLIAERTHRYYWDYEWNCATTTLKILAEVFKIPLSRQVLDAALGMHGAGEYGAQCGLVEGGLMFIGILGRDKGFPESQIVDKCYVFASRFEDRFGSLYCRVLRPEGFKPENPPHLCEQMTVKAVGFTIDYLKEIYELETG